MATEAKCEDCGGNCAPECGMHPLGCVYGGFSELTSYWIAIDGCSLDHSGPLPPLIGKMVELKAD